MDEDLDLAIRRFGEAWAAGDTAVLDTLLSPTYTHTDIFGKLLHRADWLAFAAGRSGRATTIIFREVESRVVGNIAIVTGLNELGSSGARNADDSQGIA